MPYDPFRHSADPEAVPLPRFAADIHEDAATVEMHVAWAQDALEDTLAAIASKVDDMILDPDGYGPSHAAAWAALVLQASDLAQAVAALKAKVTEA